MSSPFERFRVHVVLAAAVSVLLMAWPCYPRAELNELRQVRNVIVMISDGCGYQHIQAADVYEHGRPDAQVYHRFPVRIAMATFSADGHGYDPDAAWGSFDWVLDSPTDSAAAATAMSTGRKTYDGAIGVVRPSGGDAVVPVTHAFELAEKQGLATGVVTSVPLSHATPAGFVAHNPDRDDYSGIANEMLLRSAIDVVMGCGHPHFDDDGKPVADDADEARFRYVGGKETWESLRSGKAGADADDDGDADPWTLVETREDFQRLATGEAPPRVVGVPQVASTLNEKRSGDDKADAFAAPRNESAPTLAEMSLAAVNVLDGDPDGFALMIEGGAIDWAGHANQPGRLIEEEIDFNHAVRAVVEWIESHGGWGETLLIVTADHECGYVTGPGSGEVDGKPLWNDVENRGKGVQPGLEFHADDHTNSLVPFFANGAGAGLFEDMALRTDPVRGPYIDNTDIARALSAVFESRAATDVCASSDPTSVVEVLTRRGARRAAVERSR